MLETEKGAISYYPQELSFSDKASKTNLESGLLPFHYLPQLYDHKLTNHQETDNTIGKMHFHFHPKIVSINLLCAF